MLPVKPGRRLFLQPILLCILNKHDPDRNFAQWDGTHYIGHCLQCGQRIRRKARKDWRKDWLIEQRKPANSNAVATNVPNRTRSSG